jgi:hypothetical protein
MNRLVLQPTATAQWHDLVNEAQQVAHCRLDETLESYLVFLLERFSRRPDMLSRILGKDYLESSARPGRQREQLRDIGDHCLLFSGLFPQIAERRLVKISYFVSLGRSAYLRIATDWYDSEQQPNELFTSLAQGFVQLMDILQAIRGLDDEHNERLKPIQAFELWQETGSQQAYRVLTSISDAFPSRADDPDDPTGTPVH